MLKRSILMSLIFILASVSGNAAFADSGVTVRADGKMVPFPDARPFINEDGRTMVPVRFVSAALGAAVEWEGTRRLVTINRDSTRIALTVGQAEAVVNDGKSDVKKTFDTKAVLKDGRTFVPLRFVSEVLGAAVAWDSVNRIAIISTEKGKDADIDSFIEPVVDASFPTYKNPPSYMQVKVKNIKDYSDDYQFKIVCTNCQINIVDYLNPWLNRWETYDKSQWRTASDLKGSSGIIFSLSPSYYTDKKNQDSFKLTDGMMLNFTITAKKGGIERSYPVSFVLKIPQ